MNLIRILSNAILLQNWLSFIVSKFNPFVLHNFDKYVAIKKAFFYSSLEKIEGDYFEFGVFTGSSFCHAIQCARANKKYDNNLDNIKFYGFDSFEGFGDLSDDEKHVFFTKENFNSDYNKVIKRVRKMLPENRFNITKGYFKDTLSNESNNKIARIIFIDCDTYSSTALALNYVKPSLQLGTIIILDDYFAYRGSKNKGTYGAFKKFVTINKLKTRQLFSYGIGGVVKIFTAV